MTAAVQPLTKEDFASDQDVRWCPGCGDYAILSAMQKALPELGVARENYVFISGIGCSSRFPYYMATYGFHTIHGRAPTIATGIKAVNPDLHVWLITGDGDGLSIGGNHMIHLLRRNVDLNVILFNNEIYGLTKGQYSPTSRVGTVAKSTPFGSMDEPVQPLMFALGCGATFFARTIDRDVKHMGETFKRAPQHRGTSLVEVMQNCIVYNDGVYEEYYDAKRKFDNVLYLEHGRPMTFGKNGEHALILDGTRFVAVDTASIPPDRIATHDETDRARAFMLAALKHPLPIGVIFRADRHRYVDDLMQAEEKQIAERGPGDLRKLVYSGTTWQVK